MQARMKSPALVLPEVLQALQGIAKSVAKTGLPMRTIELVNMRASQINGCSLCLDMHGRDAKKAGETDERLFTIAGWREAPFFTEKASSSPISIDYSPSYSGTFGSPSPYPNVSVGIYITSACIDV